MFDVPVFASALLPLLAASLIVLLVNWRIHTQMRGPDDWAMAAASRLLGIGLIALADHLPLFISAIIGHMLVAVGDFLAVRGLSRFAARPRYVRTTRAVLLTTLLGCFYFTYITPDPMARLLVLVGAHVIAILLQAMLQWRLYHREGLSGIIILALSTFWESCVSPMLLLLIYLATQQAEHAELLDGPTGWILPTSALAMVGILQTFGYVLLAANRTQHELRDLALSDSLTGIPNRRAFDATMKRAIETARRTQHPLGLAIIDLDHFKQVNDQYGHEVGDQLLQHVARTLNASLRESDFLARIGGEEFALLVANPQINSFCELAERFRHQVASSPLVLNKGRMLPCTLSAGLAVVQGDALNATLLYNRADDALYQAKAGGRNLVVMAPLSPTQPMDEAHDTPHTPHA